MIVVDSSVWIDHLRGARSPQVSAFEAADPESIIAGDIIVLEVLRGVANEQQATSLRLRFAAYGITPMFGPNLALTGSTYYRRLRQIGITVSKTVDLIIATFCIAHGYELLHQDRDFDHFERHLGLKVLHPA